MPSIETIEKNYETRFNKIKNRLREADKQISSILSELQDLQLEASTYAKLARSYRHMLWQQKNNFNRYCNKSQRIHCENEDLQIYSVDFSRRDQKLIFILFEQVQITFSNLIQSISEELQNYNKVRPSSTDSKIYQEWERHLELLRNYQDSVNHIYNQLARIIDTKLIIEPRTDRINRKYAIRDFTLT